MTPDWGRKMTIVAKEGVDIKGPEMVLYIFSLVLEFDGGYHFVSVVGVE